jgi:uncharacterized protein YigA (DUF484 family)
MASRPPPYTPTDTDILAFLAGQPDKLATLLADHPEFVALCLAAAGTTKTGPAINRTGDDKKPADNILNLNPALAARARAEARKISARHQSMIHLAAENMRGWTRLHHATLALLAETDLAGLKQAISDEFPRIFDLDSAALIMTDDGQQAGAARYFTPRKAADITRALNDDNLYLGPPNDAAKLLLARPADSIAAIRLPDRLPGAVSGYVLILGGKTADSFGPDLGSDLLVLLAEMVGVALAARLDLGVSADD